MPSAQTTMLSSLPLEIFDLVINNLHRQGPTIKACCLVSKSWALRIRKHLFAHIDFLSHESIGSWMEAFPDPLNSPAHHVHSIRIYAEALTAITSSNARPWLRSFRSVASLRLAGHRTDGGFLEAVDLICSFPLLKNISFYFSASGGNIGSGWVLPSTSPKLDGHLVLGGGGAGAVIRQLLPLPGGLHFAGIQALCSAGDAKSVADLVLSCSHTLESLKIRYTSTFPSAPVAGQYLIVTTVTATSRKPPPLDLSMALKLKDVEFWSDIQDVQWITKSLRSIQFRNLRQVKIAINLPARLLNPVGKLLHHKLMELDRLLVNLWTSHSVDLWVECRAANGRSLLPEITSKEGVRILED